MFRYVPRMPRRSLVDQLHVLEELLAKTTAALPAQAAKYRAKLDALHGGSAYERGVILEELATTRFYMAGGHHSFVAFLAAEKIPRTTAHRLRTGARMVDASVADQWGTHAVYRHVRRELGDGYGTDPAAVRRAMGAWLRLQGYSRPKVTVVPWGRRMRLQMEIDLVEASVRLEADRLARKRRRRR